MSRAGKTGISDGIKWWEGSGPSVSSVATVADMDQVERVEEERL